MFFLLHSRYQVLWADDGVRLRRALNALLERAYAKRQVGFGWNEFVGSKLSPSILVLKHLLTSPQKMPFQKGDDVQLHQLFYTVDGF